MLAVAEELGNVVGVVALHPSLAAGKANYDMLADFRNRRRDSYLWTKDINDTLTFNWLVSQSPEVIIQCGWSQIFTPDTIQIASKLCIGIHPSPLPVGRGAAVINWRLLEGGGEWGNSLFVMEPKTDHGPVLDFEPFLLERRDDVFTAHLKVNRTAVIMLRRTLPKIANGTAAPIAQDRSKVTRYYKRCPADGLMKFEWAAEKLLNYIRGLTMPFPGGFVEATAGKIFIWRANRGKDSSGKIPGTVLGIERGEGIRVQVGEGQSVWLTLIRPPNDLDCWADEWAFEQRIEVGQKL